jgi:transposase
MSLKTKKFGRTDEQQSRIETLEKENRELRAENLTLRQELDEFKASLDAKIKAAVEAAVAAATAPLMEQIKEKDAEIGSLKKRILELEASQNKNSKNSSKPPSSNGFKQIPNCREKSGRDTGGQINHPGRRLHLPDNLDSLIEAGWAEKKLVDHTGGSEEYVSRWVVDTQMKVIFTEHRYAPGKIPPEMNNEVTYGDNIKAQTVMLSCEGIVAQERLADLFSGMTKNIINLSDATIGSFLHQFAGKLDDEIETIKNRLLEGHVMHVDESPMRCAQKPIYKNNKEAYIETAEGKTFLVQTRTHSNEQTTLFTVNPQKDMEGVKRDGILTNYRNTLVHDHDIKMYNYGGAHGECGVHVVRRLIGLRDLYRIPWADTMRVFLLEMNTHKNVDTKKNVNACKSVELLEYENRYDKIVGLGAAELEKISKEDFGYSELRAMIEYLLTYKDAIMLFIHDYEVPFCNSLAERDLRPEKTKQKVSGCFRSWQGMQDYVESRSFISTVKKCGLDLLASIKQVYEGRPVLI